MSIKIKSVKVHGNLLEFFLAAFKSAPEEHYSWYQNNCRIYLEDYKQVTLAELKGFGREF